MRQHELENYSAMPEAWEDLTIKDGDSFVMCNLSQREPDTVLFKTKKDLMFWRCNLVNVKIQPTWKTFECNTAKNDYEEIIDPVTKEKTLEVKQYQGKTETVVMNVSDAKKITDRISNALLKEYKTGVVKIG